LHQLIMENNILIIENDTVFIFFQLKIQLNITISVLNILSQCGIILSSPCIQLLNPKPPHYNHIMEYHTVLIHSIEYTFAEVSTY